MFQPLNDLVLIQTLTVEDGTIIKPDMAVEASSRGIVRALPDPGEFLALKNGETVLFNHHGATDVPDMKGFVLVAYPELLGVWKEEPAKVKSAGKT
jgi:co-chaperonin GroES (HSP10)